MSRIDHGLVHIPGWSIPGLVHPWVIGFGRILPISCGRVVPMLNFLGGNNQKSRNKINVYYFIIK